MDRIGFRLAGGPLNSFFRVHLEMEQALFRRMCNLAQGGDEDAADVLFVSAFDSLYALVSQRLNSILRAGALEPEDVIQEVYAAAWPKLASSRFPDHGTFVHWLRTIARNYMVDLYRRLRADKRDVLRTVAPPGSGAGYLSLIDRLEGDHRSPSQGAARREALAIMATQMWRLPEDYRQVIRLRFIQGLRVPEVARQLGRTESAVHMLCHRALKRLRTQMGTTSKYLTG